MPSRTRKRIRMLTGQHVLVSAVGNSEDVGRHFVTPFASVDLHGAVGVDGETLVRVDGHAEETRVGLLDSTSLNKTTGQIRHAINRNQTKKNGNVFRQFHPDNNNNNQSKWTEKQPDSHRLWDTGCHKNYNYPRRHLFCKMFRGQIIGKEMDQVREPGSISCCASSD